MHSSAQILGFRQTSSSFGTNRAVRVTKKPLTSRLGQPLRHFHFQGIPNFGSHTRTSASTGQDPTTKDSPPDESSLPPLEGTREERVQALLQDIQDMRLDAALSGLGTTPGYNPSTDLRPSMFYTPIKYDSKPSTIQRAGIAYEAAARVEALIQRKKQSIISGDSGSAVNNTQLSLEKASEKVNRLVDETREWQRSIDAVVSSAAGTKEEVDVLRTCVTEAQEHQDRLSEDLIKQSQLAGELVKLAAEASLVSESWYLPDGEDKGGPMDWVTGELATQMETVKALEGALLHKIEEYDARLESMEDAEVKLKQAEELLGLQELQIKTAMADLKEMLREVDVLSAALAASPQRLAKMEAEVMGPLEEAEKAMEEMVQATHDQQELLMSQISELQSEVASGKALKEKYDAAVRRETEYQSTIEQLNKDLLAARDQAKKAKEATLAAPAVDPAVEVRLRHEIRDLREELRNKAATDNMYNKAIERGKKYLERVYALEEQLAQRPQLQEQVVVQQVAAPPPPPPPTPAAPPVAGATGISESEAAAYAARIDELEMQLEVLWAHEALFRQAEQKEEQYKITIQNLHQELRTLKKQQTESPEALVLQQMLKMKEQLGRSLSDKDIQSITEMLDPKSSTSQLAAKVCELEQAVEEARHSAKDLQDVAQNDLRTRLSEMEAELNAAKAQEGVWSEALERESEYQETIRDLRTQLAQAQETQSTSAASLETVAQLQGELEALRVKEAVWAEAAKKEREYQDKVQRLQFELRDTKRKAEKQYKEALAAQVREREESLGHELTLQDILHVEMELIARVGENRELESKVSQLEEKLHAAQDTAPVLEFMSEKIKSLKAELEASNSGKDSWENSRTRELMFATIIEKLETDVKAAKRSAADASVSTSQEKRMREKEVAHLEAELRRAKQHEGEKGLWSQAVETVYQETIQELLQQLEQEQSKALTQREEQLLIQVHKTEQRLGREITSKEISALDSILSQSTSTKALQEKIARLENRLAMAEKQNIPTLSKPAPPSATSFWGEPIEDSEWANKLGF